MRAELGKGMAEAVPFSLDGGFMDNQTKWTELLQQAVIKPGLILRAYSAFHGYSLSNQVAALIQCQQRNLELGPINTYPGWQKLNRQVRKGEKAIWLCMPLTRKMKEEASGDEQTIITTFVWKPHWFVLAQTEGLHLTHKSTGDEIYTAPP